jgi:hypothetical protein
MEAKPSEKKKTSGPSYDASWWRFYEQMKDVNGVMLSGGVKLKITKLFTNIIRKIV